MTTEGTALSEVIRAWRERVSPAAVGLPAGGRRRVSGLRREEMAALAGISVDYLVRLEQGRAVHPSPQILVALARALRLSERERGLLYRTAGVALPSAGIVPRFVPAGIQRMVDRLADTPVGVFTAAWDAVQWNAMWAALLGDPSERGGRDRNIVWKYFIPPDPGLDAGLDAGAAGDGSGRRIAHEGDGLEIFEREMVADLRAAADRYPNDRELGRMITDLRRESVRFEELRGRFEATPRSTARKTVRHPLIGPITLDCDVLTVEGSDLRVVVYTAEPGSAAAASLDLLRVTGVQNLADAG